MVYLIEDELMGKRAHIITDYSKLTGKLIRCLKYEESHSSRYSEDDLKCFNLKGDSYSYYYFISFKISTGDVIVMG